MIPKVIHYCWFGRNPLPELAKKCIESWKKYLPDYEIKEWNEDNFDVNIIPYTKEAYEAKKYAFVSDYARFWILYHHGGLYFDTDVEVIKPMYDIIERGPFMGCEKLENVGVGITSGIGANPGLGLGANPGLDLYKELLDKYATLHFFNKDGSLNQKTIVSYTSELLQEKGLKYVQDVEFCGGVYIYHYEYFCPKSYKTGKLKITKRTVSIHHYDSSWMSKSDAIKRKISKLLGLKLTSYLLNFKSSIKRKYDKK